MQLKIGNLRLDPVGRMGLIIEALYRLIVELPEIQAETVKGLAFTEELDTVTPDLRFLPDEDDGTGNRQKIARELHAVPGAPEIEGVQGLIREAFKAHVGRSDSDLRI